MKLIDHPASVGEVFNIGSTEEVSIQQLAETVRRLARSSSDIVYVPYDEAYEAGFEDMPRRVPDTSKIEKLIGFRTTHNLEDIVRSVIEFERGVAEAAKPQIYAEVRA
jgi:UDP-glucose 4-epimerase